MAMGGAARRLAVFALLGAIAVAVCLVAFRNSSHPGALLSGRGGRNDDARVLVKAVPAIERELQLLGEKLDDGSVQLAAPRRAVPVPEQDQAINRVLAQAGVGARTASEFDAVTGGDAEPPRAKAGMDGQVARLLAAAGIGRREARTVQDVTGLERTPLGVEQRNLLRLQSPTTVSDDELTKQIMGASRLDGETRELLRKWLAARDAAAGGAGGAGAGRSGAVAVVEAARGASDRRLAQRALAHLDGSTGALLARWLGLPARRSGRAAASEARAEKRAETQMWERVQRQAAVHEAERRLAARLGAREERLRRALEAKQHEIDGTRPPIPQDPAALVPELTERRAEDNEAEELRAPAAQPAPRDEKAALRAALARLLRRVESAAAAPRATGLAAGPPAREARAGALMEQLQGQPRGRGGGQGRGGGRGRGRATALTWPRPVRTPLPEGAYRSSDGGYNSDYNWPSTPQVAQGDEWQLKGDCGGFGNNC